MRGSVAVQGSSRHETNTLLAMQTANARDSFVSWRPFPFFPFSSPARVKRKIQGKAFGELPERTRDKGKGKLERDRKVV